MKIAHAVVKFQNRWQLLLNVHGEFKRTVLRVCDMLDNGDVTYSNMPRVIRLPRRFAIDPCACITGNYLIRKWA